MDKPVALITGASSGIGAATARRLCADYRLILVARRQQRLQELTLALDADAEAHAIICDLCDRTQRQGLMEQALMQYGQLDVLINNAGIFETAPADALVEHGLDRMWELNVTAPLLLTRDAIPHLRRSQAGHIVNISSIAAVSDFAGCSAYAASKAALEAWSRSLREELRSDGIRVSVVAPGATSTEIWDGKEGFDTSKMIQASDIAESIAVCLQMPATASVDYMTVMPPTGAL